MQSRESLWMGIAALVFWADDVLAATQTRLVSRGMASPMKWTELRRRETKINPWRIIEEIDFRLPDGTEQTYAVKKESEVVALLALDAMNNVILAKQYRPGPNEVLEEIPGGRIEEGEDPLEAAKRELLEETGYEVGEVIRLGTLWDCAYSTLKRHAFVATNCRKVAEPRLDATEWIEVVVKPLTEFVSQLESGRLTDPEIGWHGLFKLGLLGPGR